MRKQRHRQVKSFPQNPHLEKGRDRIWFSQFLFRAHVISHWQQWIAEESSNISSAKTLESFKTVWAGSGFTQGFIPEAHHAFNTQPHAQMHLSYTVPSSLLNFSCLICGFSLLSRPCAYMTENLFSLHIGQPNLKTTIFLITGSDAHSHEGSTTPWYRSWIQTQRKTTILDLSCWTWYWNSQKAQL